MTFTGGYSFQQFNTEGFFFSLRDFPDNSLDYINAIEASQDLNTDQNINAFSFLSPDERIIAFFGRLNLTINEGIFINASVRQEGSSKLGENNRWGTFPAFGVGVDLNRFLELSNVDLLKVRAGYGVTGSLPRDNGLFLDGREISENSPGGGFATRLNRVANPDLKWEEKGSLT